MVVQHLDLLVDTALGRPYTPDSNRRDLEPEDPMETNPPGSNPPGWNKPAKDEGCDCDKPSRDPCEWMMMTEQQRMQYRCEKRREAYRKRLACSAYKKQYGDCIKSIVKTLLPKKTTYKRRTYYRSYYPRSTATLKKKTYRKRTPATRKRPYYKKRT